MTTRPCDKPGPTSRKREFARLLGVPVAGVAMLVEALAVLVRAGRGFAQKLPLVQLEREREMRRECLPAITCPTKGCF